MSERQVCDVCHCLTYNYVQVGERFVCNEHVTLEHLIPEVKRLNCELTEANRRLTEIRDELCGKGFEVSGWHQNGDLQPLDTWWDDNDWGPVEAAKGGREP